MELVFFRVTHEKGGQEKIVIVNLVLHENGKQVFGNCVGTDGVTVLVSAINKAASDLSGRDLPEPVNPHFVHWQRGGGEFVFFIEGEEQRIFVPDEMDSLFGTAEAFVGHLNKEVNK